MQQTDSASAGIWDMIWIYHSLPPHLLGSSEIQIFPIGMDSKQETDPFSINRLQHPHIPGILISNGITLLTSGPQQIVLDT
jgi:hypothetical protein